MIYKLAVLVSIILFAGVTAVAQPAEAQQGAKLKVGDAAPGVKVDAWVKGRAVRSLEKDKVYVVEFWATWCPPCVRAIPHLTELQQKHQRDGLVVIGVAASERGRDAKDKHRIVSNFVGRQGRNMNYTVAFADDRTMWQDWMSAAGRNGIPSAFVVGKNGKISYIGSPGDRLTKAVEDALKAPGSAMIEQRPDIRLASWQPGASADQPRQPDAAAKMLKAVKEKEPEPITIGDKAPAIKVSSWVKGDEVSAFERGKTYVVEFWATWCGPCIAAIPHLTELQEQYKDDVRIIGVSIWESNPDGVEAFVQDKGEEMEYTVAKDLIPAAEEETREGWRAASREGYMARHWMGAAARNGIPTTFIVNGEGRIAWIGHPMRLDEPLAQVVAGTWDLEAFGSTFRASQEMDRKRQPLMMQLRRASAAEDWDLAVKTIDELMALDERMRSTLAFQKFHILLIGKQDFDRAYGFAERAIETDLKDNAIALNNIAWAIVDPAHEHLAIRDLQLARKAAERAMMLTEGKAGFIIDTLAKVHFDLDELDRAIELQEKALQVSQGEPYEEELRDRLKQYRAASEANRR